MTCPYPTSGLCTGERLSPFRPCSRLLLVFALRGCDPTTRSHVRLTSFPFQQYLWSCVILQGLLERALPLPRPVPALHVHRLCMGRRHAWRSQQVSVACVGWGGQVLFCLHGCVPCVGQMLRCLAAPGAEHGTAMLNALPLLTAPLHVPSTPRHSCAFPHPFAALKVVLRELPDLWCSGAQQQLCAQPVPW